MWKNYELPLFCEIDGKQFKLNTDWRNIVDIFECLNTNDLLIYEKLELSLDKFYVNFYDIKDIQAALLNMFVFINGNKFESGSKKTANENEIKIIDWSKDLPLIIPPVNKVLGYDIREKEYLHWWTFLGAFNEIGECQFRTYVNIRYKLELRRPLEKWEKDLYFADKERIVIRNDSGHKDFDNEDILVQLSKNKSGRG